MKKHTTAAEVEEALSDAGLGGVFDSIEDNPATPGEVILWAGGGQPVYTIEAAIQAAKSLKAEVDAEE